MTAAERKCLTIHERLAFAGFSHERTSDTNSTGRHWIYASDGRRVGSMDAKEACDFLKTVEPRS